ncbi:MAG: efflux RND transporter permease subunit [Bacteroidota bacterium]
MSLSSISIKRPVLTIVISMLIVLFGVVGYNFLGLREYPAIDPPVITVSTSYSGANPDVIETQITEPLEESINGIDGIRSLTSSSSMGSSTITVEFNLGVDMEAAANDVRDRVSRASRLLPQDLAAPPVVSKSDANSDAIIMTTLQSSSRSHLEVSYWASSYIKERIQTIPGVSQIQMWGEKKYAMRIWLDPANMAAYNITPADVKLAFDREHIELPSGRIQGDASELNIRTVGRMEKVEEFDNLIIKTVGDKIIRLKDLGSAQLGPEVEETVMRQSGVPMIGIGIIPLPDANYIDIANEFYKRLDKIKAEMPKDFELNVAIDTTKFIRSSVKEVEETVLLAFVLVLLVIYLFLRSWRSTLIPVIAIPISLVSAFFIMYLAGFSINILTLLAIVLATGLVVDDAIVVLENIYSKIEKGMSPVEASFKGAKEIYFAIISTTVTLAAVFLPIIFLEGFTGRLFREFGVVLAGTIIVSAVVSLTLTPMMSSRILKVEQKKSWFYNFSEKYFVGLSNAYASALNGFMNHRWWSIVIVGVASAFIFIIGSLVPTELSPMEDRGMLRLSVTAPEGASFDYTDRVVRDVIKIVGDSVPEKLVFITNTAPGHLGSGNTNRASGRMVLIDKKLRKRSQQEIAAYLTKKVSGISAAKVFIIQDQSIGSGVKGGLPVQFVIQASNMEKLRTFLPKFMTEVNKSKVLQMADVNLKFNKPEINIEINRDKAKTLGVSVQDVAQTLQLYLSEYRFGYFTLNGKQYQIIGQVPRENRDEPSDLSAIYVRNKDGELIQLDNLVDQREESAPPALFHFNRYKSATVTAGLAAGYTLGDGNKEMKRIASEVLDETFSTSLAGQSRDFEESSSNILFALLLALVLIYLVLSAQFESFRDPLIIMLTVPLAMSGAVLSLWYFNQTINIFSEIGIIMLIGLVTKNGILIVEFANQKREAGLSIKDAVLFAAEARFRPILMTSLATMLGAVPIALALGAGAESRTSLGIVIIFGLLLSLVLTLFVIPAMYTYLTSKKDRKLVSEDDFDESK